MPSEALATEALVSRAVVGLTVGAAVGMVAAVGCRVVTCVAWVAVFVMAMADDVDTCRGTGANVV